MFTGRAHARVERTRYLSEEPGGGNTWCPDPSCPARPALYWPGVSYSAGDRKEAAGQRRVFLLLCLRKQFRWLFLCRAHTPPAADPPSQASHIECSGGRLRVPGLGLSHVSPESSWDMASVPTLVLTTSGRYTQREKVGKSRPGRAGPGRAHDK